LIRRLLSATIRARKADMITDFHEHSLMVVDVGTCRHCAQARAVKPTQQRSPARDRQWESRQEKVPCCRKPEKIWAERLRDAHRVVAIIAG